MRPAANGYAISVAQAGRVIRCRRPEAPVAEFDVRAWPLIRETLAWHDGLADFAFAMQGFEGSGAISRSSSHRDENIDTCRASPPAGRIVALSEPDLARTLLRSNASARREGEDRTC